MAEQLPQGVHIVGVDGHNIAVSVGVEIFNGQCFHVVEQVVPKVTHGALADVDHNPVVGKGGNHAHSHNTGQTHQVGSQFTEIGGTVGHHRYDILIHQLLREGSSHHCGNGSNQNADNHQDKLDFIVMKHILDDPLDERRRRGHPGLMFSVLHKTISSFLNYAG